MGEQSVARRLPGATWGGASGSKVLQRAEQWIKEGKKTVKWTRLW